MKFLIAFLIGVLICLVEAKIRGNDYSRYVHARSEVINELQAGAQDMKLQMDDIVEAQKQQRKQWRFPHTGGSTNVAGR